jgi:hypothetical protein
VKDLRDPIELGEKLLHQKGLWRIGKLGQEMNDAPLSLIAEHVPLHVRDYDSNPGPIEKYGRPQDIKSTMPCAVG